MSQEVQAGAPPEPADWLGALQSLKAVFVFSSVHPQCAPLLHREGIVLGH